MEHEVLFIRTNNGVSAPTGSFAHLAENRELATVETFKAEEKVRPS